MDKQGNEPDSTPASRLTRTGLLTLLRRYAQFCLVGATGMAVDMGLLHLLASPTLLGWNLSLSKVVAAEVALVNNFVWNELWTFRPRAGTNRAGAGKWLARLAKFNLICVAGIGWSVLLLNAQVHWLGLNVYLANFVAIVLVSIWNFCLSLRFGWRLPQR